MKGSRSRSRAIGFRDPQGVALLAVLAQDAGQVLDRVAVDDVGRRRPGRRVHPHVERRVQPIGEAALGLVQLPRGDTEVEEHALHTPDAEAMQHLGELVVDRMDGMQPVAEPLEPAAGQPQCARVAVQPHQLRLRAGREQRLGMPAHAQRRVHDDRAGRVQGRREQGRDPVAHDRLVPVLRADASTVAVVTAVAVSPSCSSIDCPLLVRMRAVLRPAVPCLRLPCRASCGQVPNRSGCGGEGLRGLAPGKVRQDGGERVETSSQEVPHMKPGTTSSAWSANASSVDAR